MEASHNSILDDLQLLQGACMRDRNELIGTKESLAAATSRIEQLSKELMHSRAESIRLREAVQAGQDNYASEVCGNLVLDTVETVDTAAIAAICPCPWPALAV